MVVSEALPYSKTGGLGDVGGALPAALARLGHEVTVVTPRYRGVEGGEDGRRLRSRRLARRAGLPAPRAPARGRRPVLDARLSRRTSTGTASTAPPAATTRTTTGGSRCWRGRRSKARARATAPGHRARARLAGRAGAGVPAHAVRRRSRARAAPARSSPSTTSPTRACSDARCCRRWTCRGTSSRERAWSSGTTSAS